MAFEGYIDRADATEISGWIFDNRAPNQPLDLEILDGEEIIAKISAGNARADLLAAGKGNGEHAFLFQSPTPAKTGLFARVVGARWLIPPSGGYVTSHLLPMRFDKTLSHSLEYGLPGAISQQGFSRPITAGENIEIAHRLIRAFKKTIADDPAAQNRKNDQWADLETHFHQEILSLLKNEDAHGLLLYLQDAHARGLTHGITQGEHTTGVLRSNPAARRLVMLATLDHLTSLAEYLGVLDVECPDQHGHWGENIHADPSVIVERISSAIGMQLVVPQVVGSSFGLLTGHGVVSTRDLLALYAALRIRTLLGAPRNGLPSGTVCEIGGGLGGVAYYAHRLGIADYTIIDLPLVSLLQGYFLIRALPESRIALYGEDPAGAAIKLLPTYAFAGLTSPVDLLFNMDSMPEMHREYSVGYLKAALAKKIPQFLSINQEARAPQNQSQSQTVVRELIADAAAGGIAGRLATGIGCERGMWKSCMC